MEIVRETLEYNGLYRGVVVDNEDPDKLGRIRVNVFGIYNGIPTSSLPWAVPMFPVGFGAGDGYGVFMVPSVGSNVFVMFERSDVYQPLYVGSAPDGVHGLPTERTTNYPNRRVIKSTSGIVVYIDDTAEEIVVSHPSGAKITVDTSGVSVVGGEVNVTASGNVTITGSRVDINP